MIGTDEITGDLGRVAGETVNTYAFTIGTLDAGSNYSLSVAAEPTFTITSRPITITVDPGQTKVYGEADPLEFTYTVGGDGLATGDDFDGALTRMSGEPVGSYAIEKGTLTIVEGATNKEDNYDLTFEGADFTITPKQLTITAEDQTKIYGDVFTFDMTSPSDDFTVTGLEADDEVSNITLASDGAAATANVAGSPYDIVPSAAVGPGLDNYDIEYINGEMTVDKRAFTVSITGNPTKTYDGNDEATLEASDYSVDNLANDDIINVLQTEGTYASANAGTHLVTVTLAETDFEATVGTLDNYELPTEATGNGTIEKKDLQVTAVAADIIYGDPAPAVTVEYEGFVDGEGEEDLLNAGFVLGTDYTQFDDVGTYNTTIAIGTATDNNYNFNPMETSTFEVEARDLILSNFVADDKTYDGNTDVLSGDGFDDDRVEGDVLTFSYDVAFEDENVGEDKDVLFTNIAISGGADAGNYTLVTTTGTAQANIDKKELTVTGAVADNKTYDGTTDATISGATLEGVVAGEDIELDDLLGTFDQADVGTDIPVAAELTIKGTEDDPDNYFITQPTGLTADITQKELTIAGSFTAKDKVYDGGTSATFDDNNLTLEVIEGTDDVTLTNIVLNFADPNVATGIEVSITGANLAGAQKDNYTLSFAGAPTTTADITAKELTIAGTFTAENKVYNGDIVATFDDNDLELEVIEGADEVELDNVVIHFADANVANDIIVSIHSAELAGAQKATIPYHLAVRQPQQPTLLQKNSP